MIHVLHEHSTERAQASFGITHRGWRITFHGTKIALSLDQGLTHRPRLGHVNEGRINSLVTMRVIITHGLTDDLGTLEVLAGRHHTQFAHREQDAALRGFQTIAGIGKGSGNDYRHGVIEEGAGDLLGDINRFYFFVLVIQGIGPLGRFGVGSAQYRDSPPYRARVIVDRITNR